MSTKVFLSLSNVDEDFVSDIHARLPKGLAYFYKESFENGEFLLAAMERTVNDAAIFILFASKEALSSSWVGFEIKQARLDQIRKPSHKILVFPTHPNVSLSDIPIWLRQYWISQAGLSPNDIARYITTVLLEPNEGLSEGAIRVVGRGKALDKLEQLTADHISRKNRSPNVYVLAGVSGIGRRTFAKYYMRRALTASANLVYGPSIILSPQADLLDLYRALRNEIEPIIDPKTLSTDFKAFQNLEIIEQIEEINRLIHHFSNLGQALTLVSTAGFFEDRGEPKEWVSLLLSSIPENAMIFLVSNRQFQNYFIERNENVIQIRIEELDNKDVKTLMIFTSERLRIEKFNVSSNIVQAIGGHADVANAAVRLVALKGAHILERDPRQLFNIQNTILGENIHGDALSNLEKRILNVLSWVPNLGGDLLEKIVFFEEGIKLDDFINSIEGLVLSCLVTVAGHTYSISPAIRHLYRRWHITPPELLEKFAGVLSEAWEEAERVGRFRLDLFDAFVFMHALEGKTLPHELRSLLSPGTLHDVVREAYVRGKDADDSEELTRVISWGEIAESMRMSEATREEILSTVVRAKIRLGYYPQAEETIAEMQKKGYRSVLFLRGHMLRRRERYADAIPILEEAILERKYNRSSLHELALAYKRYGRFYKLRKLLKDHDELVKKSAMFTDFQVGVDLARGDFPAAEVGIANLRTLVDDDGKSNIREAQLLIRRGENDEAKNLLTRLLVDQKKRRFHIRSLRACAAAKSNDFALARSDLDFVRSIPSRQIAALRLEATILAEEGNLKDAEIKLKEIRKKSPQDWLLEARILELKAELPETGLSERTSLMGEAAEIRTHYNFASEYDYDE